SPAFKILLNKSTLKPPPTPAPGDGKCQTFWIPYGRYCYYVHNGKQGFSWPDSHHYCQSAKANLVSIHSRAEVEFLRNLNYTKYHNIWIGLTRDRNFGWGWTDLTSLGFLNWAQGEPNAAFHPGEVGEENCVEMYQDGRWNDNNCLQKRGFACRHRQCKDIFFKLFDIWIKYRELQALFCSLHFGSQSSQEKKSKKSF
uniref:C-type lectin domain-containing protein n=1 Tax=Sander lucioperca TaxID=283035 RepID=A0A8D0D2B6_SANLU